MRQVKRRTQQIGVYFEERSVRRYSSRGGLKGGGKIIKKEELVENYLSNHGKKGKLI